MLAATWEDVAACARIKDNFGPGLTFSLKETGITGSSGTYIAEEGDRESLPWRNCHRHHLLPGTEAMARVVCRDITVAVQD